MNKYLRSIVGGLAIAMAMSAAYAQADDAYIRSFDAPNVYVMSNDINANSVAVLKRDFFGGLSKVAVVPTGGKGVGVGTTAPPPDPLGSQNALLKSQDGHWLYAVNAGSDQLSVFAILQDGLQLVDVVASGGTYPVSLAQRGNRLFVLNSAGVASINVFEIGAAGDLYPVANETRVIGTTQPLVTNQPNVGMTPAQLQFTPDGKWLVVSVKDASAKGYFELFGADRQGNLAQDPVISLSNDAQPFGFAFDDNGHLISSEAAGSAASSYAVDRDGSLTAISADVLNGQAATCWLAVSGRYAYTSNAGTGNISSYRIDDVGHLTLVQRVAGTLEAGAAATDIKASPDGSFLYVVNSLGGDVDTFLIASDGQLIRVGSTSVFPLASGMQGLAL